MRVLPPLCLPLQAHLPVSVVSDRWTESWMWGRRHRPRDCKFRFTEPQRGSWEEQGVGHASFVKKNLRKRASSMTFALDIQVFHV